MVDTQIVNLLLFCRIWYQFIVWPWLEYLILSIMKCLIYFLATLLSRAYMKTLQSTPKSWICLCSVENYINLLFNLAQMAAILDFTQNAMSKNTFWQHHYISGIPENHLVDTQIMYHYILLKLYEFIVCPHTNGGHFISAYLQVSVSILTFFPAYWRLAAI